MTTELNNILLTIIEKVVNKGEEVCTIVSTEGGERTIMLSLKNGSITTTRLKKPNDAKNYFTELQYVDYNDGINWKYLNMFKTDVSTAKRILTEIENLN